MSDRHPVSARETMAYFPSSQNLGALKKPTKHQKTPTQSPFPSYPSNSITCQTALRIHMRRIYSAFAVEICDLISLSVQAQSSIVFSASARRLQAAPTSFQMGTVISSSFQFYKSKRDLWINWNKKRNGYGAIYWILNSFELTAPASKFNIILSCLPEEINTSEAAQTQVFKLSSSKLVEGHHL